MSYRFAKVYRTEHSNPAIGSAVLHLETRMWLLSSIADFRGPRTT